MTIAGLGNSAARFVAAAGVFAGHYAQIGHQLRSTGESPQVTNFGDDHRGRQQIYAAQGQETVVAGAQFSRKRS